MFDKAERFVYTYLHRRINRRTLERQVDTMNYQIKISKKWNERGHASQVEFEDGFTVKVDRHHRRLRDAARAARKLAAIERELAA